MYTQKSSFDYNNIYLVTLSLLLFHCAMCIPTIYAQYPYPICKTTIYFYQWQNNTVPNIMNKLNGIRLIVFTVAQALKYATGVFIYRLHFNLDSVVIAWIDASVMIENPLFGDFGRFLDLLYMQFFFLHKNWNKRTPIAYRPLNKSKLIEMDSNFIDVFSFRHWDY